MSGYLVLIIDDDKSLLRIVEEKLSLEGMRTLAVLNGNLGVHKAQTEKPDLIVLDMMMGGGMSGFNVLEELRKDPSTKNIPVIVLTNLDLEDKVAKVVGVKDYFIKANTDLDDLCGRINQILDRKEVKREV